MCAADSFQILDRCRFWVLVEFASLRLGCSEDDVSNGVDECYGHEVVPVHDGAPLDQVLGDECGDKGESEVGADQVQAQSGMHVVVGKEEVLLEEHGVKGIQNLEA